MAVVCGCFADEAVVSLRFSNGCFLVASYGSNA